MPGNQPDQRTYIKDEEGNLKMKLVAEWKQSKGQLTGKIKVTEEIAALFQPGAIIPVITFPNKPKPTQQAVQQQEPAA